MDKVSVYSENEKKELMRKYEISVWLDTYDDIFSDFDSRPYSERALSDDFLAEMKRASRDKPSGNIELNLLIPAKNKSFAHEALVRGRMKEHFKKHYLRMHNEIKATRKKGGWLTMIGMVMMLGATYLVSLKWETFLGHLSMIILEPGGWFLMWTGLEHVFYRWEQKKPELEFYEKMSKAEVVFHAY